MELTGVMASAGSAAPPASRRLPTSTTMDRSTLQRWLRERDPTRLDALFAEADAVRHAHVGDAVHLRGLVEISSHCRRNCTYCGIRAGNFSVERFRLTAGEVVECARQVAAFGCGTVVLQGGEDPALDVGWHSDVIRRIKGDTGLAVTLSLGELPPTDLAQLRAAGADRYLLRFETSNARLYARVHPPHQPGEPNRRELLGRLRELGFEVGSGVMVGLPGTTFEDLTNDLLAFRELDLDMIGIGPYIPHPETPLGRRRGPNPADQVPNDVATSCTALALTRILCPRSSIPATTALATVSPDGRALGLRAGANVWMPNFTPPRYRASYEIYPGKASPRHDEIAHETVLETITLVGRHVGRGPGPSPNFVARTSVSAH